MFYKNDAYNTKDIVTDDILRGIIVEEKKVEENHIIKKRSDSICVLENWTEFGKI